MSYISQVHVTFHSMSSKSWVVADDLCSKKLSGASAREQGERMPWNKPAGKLRALSIRPSALFISGMRIKTAALQHGTVRYNRYQSSCGYLRRPVAAFVTAFPITQSNETAQRKKYTRRKKRISLSPCTAKLQQQQQQRNVAVGPLNVVSGWMALLFDVCLGAYLCNVYYGGRLRTAHETSGWAPGGSN